MTANDISSVLQILDDLDVDGAGQDGTATITNTISATITITITTLRLLLSLLRCLGDVWVISVRFLSNV